MSRAASYLFFGELRRKFKTSPHPFGYLIESEATRKGEWGCLRVRVES